MLDIDIFVAIVDERDLKKLNKNIIVALSNMCYIPLELLNTSFYKF